MRRLAFRPLAALALLVLHAALPTYAAETQAAQTRSGARRGVASPTLSTGESLSPSTAAASSTTGSGRVLWGADEWGVVKLDPAAPENWIELNSSETDVWDVWAIVADAERQILWGSGWADVSSSMELRAYRFDGALLRVITRPLSRWYTQQLRQQPDDGSLWQAGTDNHGIGWRVWHLDPFGSVVLDFPVDSTVYLLEPDPARGRVWVGTSTTLRAYSTATGQVLQTIDLALPTKKVQGRLEYTSFLRAGVLEPDSGHLWVSLDHVLRRYDATGTLVLEVAFPTTGIWDRGPVLDDAGGVWVGSVLRIVRYDRAGQLLVDIPQPFTSSAPLSALAADPLDDSLWAGSYTYRWFSATGTALLEGNWWLLIQALAITPDVAPPALVFTTPAAGAALNTSAPSLDITYTSVGAGIDPATLAFTANGVPLAVTCMHTESGAACTPTSPLPDGPHVVTATVADTAGHQSAPAEVAFTIDTVVPGLAVTTPADGLVTNVPQVVVTGEVDEAVTITIRLDGAAVESFPLPSAASFDSSPLTLSEGTNLVEVLALDAAGNQAQVTRTVTLDTVPPAAPGTGTIVVGDVTGGQVTVSGLAGSVEPGLTVTIENLRTGETLTVVARADGSFTATLAAQEGDAFAISATDAAGNTSPATETTVGAPRGTYVDALWVSTSEAFLKVTALDGAVLAEVAEPTGLRAAAVDVLRSAVWAYRPGTLLTCDLTGTPLGSLALALPPDYTEATPVRLIPGPAGGVWLAVGNTVRRIDAQRSVRVTATLAEPIVALAWPGVLGRLWVATPTAVTAYQEVPIDRQTSRLDPVATLDLGGLAPSDLVVDPASGSLWVALEGRVRRYDATGAVAAEAPYGGTGARLALDGQGGVWVAAETEVLRLDGAGAVQAALSPWPGLEPPLAIVGQPRDGSAWVAGATTLTQVDGSGQVRRALALRAPLEARDLVLYADLFAPSVSFIQPAHGSVVDTNRPTLTFSYNDIGSGIDPTTLAVTANGGALALTCTADLASATCDPANALPEGSVALRTTIGDRAGNIGTAEASITIDTIVPTLVITAPVNGLVTDEAAQTIIGEVSEPVSLTIRLNGEAVQSGPVSSGPFTSSPLVLVEGSNTVEVLALDRAGRQASVGLTVTLDTLAPAAVGVGRLVLGDLSNGQVTVSGSAGSVEPNALVTVTNLRTGESVLVFAAADGSFSTAIAAQVGDTLSVVVGDPAGNESSAVTAEVVSPPSDVPPPDPSTVASPVDPGSTTDFAELTAFLYTGASPIQTGVASTTIQAQYAAVLRGAVRTREGVALTGVVITIAGHPEFGRTLSRDDGAFDLAVNGGGPLTVRYEKAGYLPAQRQVQVPWRDFLALPDVVLVPLDTQVTTVQLTAGAPAQQARGSVVSDADGQRQATVLIPAGTTAVLEFPDGTTQPVTSLAVRATEYTVGTAGPAAMPAELPPTSGYTYAVELSGDEAFAAGATTIRFSTPLVNYVENFLGFPVGGAVPAGYYDRGRGAWIPSANGRVVKILSVTDGLANLDIDGSGMPADAAALAGLGVTDTERQQLASLYTAGQSLWRVPVPHFTPWDYNWPYGPPAGATGPRQPEAETDQTEDSAECTPCPGSIIEAENQVLGEAIPITGTPFALHYRSDRVPGRQAANTYTIPLSGATLPPNLRRIDLDVRVAGRNFAQSFPAEPNQMTTFTWDSRDAYGRQLQGKQPITIRIGYVYPAVYQEPAALTASFGAVSGQPISSARSRGEVTIWQVQRGTIMALPTWYAKTQGLGGWTLTVHHAYDPVGQVLHLGTGEQRSARSLSRIIETFAGTGTAGSRGDGGQAQGAELNEPTAVAVAADGSVYIAEAAGHRVRRVGPDGLVTTVAGTGVLGFSGDGGPATSAQLDRPQSLALGPDGSLYIADYFNRRVRRVTPDGIIRTIAGNGLFDGPLNEGGLATETSVTPYGITVGNDGTLIVADPRWNSVRRVGPDGIITTVAGTGSTGDDGDGGLARQARLNSPRGVAVAPDGGVYIADTGNHRVRRVGPNGIITTVAGTGNPGDSGDGGVATEANVELPVGVTVAPDGTLYIAQYATHRVRRVTPSGVITTVAGTGTATYSGDRGPAASAGLAWPSDVDVGPDGRVYVADSENHRIRRVGLVLPTFASEEIAIPSAGGRELYRFSSTGRHLSTLDTRTGTVRYQFRYDAAGRLVEVEDRNGLITRVVRDGVGAPTAIIAPGGQGTALTLDANGYLASVTNPANESVQLTTASDGLLTAMTDARGNTYTFQYDFGRLIRDQDPATGFSAFARSTSDDGHLVTRTTAEARVSTFRVESLETGDRRFTTVDASGLQSQRRIGIDGSQVITLPDGGTTSSLLGPDPRFGMQAPVATQHTVRLPSGLTATTTRNRSVVLDDPGNPLSLRTQIETTVVNGRTYTSTYDAVTRTLVTRTPAGRETVTALDALGRVAEVRAPGLAPVTLTYDARGRLATVTEGTGPDARVTTMSYDAQDRLAGILDAENRPVAFTYDAADRVLTQTLPDNRVIQFGYDANGNVTAVTPPERPAHGFEYTPVDLEARYDPPVLPEGPTPTTRTYNTDRQPTLVTRPDAQTIGLGYDTGGRLETVVQPRGTTSLTYSPTTGQVASVTAPDGSTLGYTYDGRLLKSVTWGAGPITGSVAWTYDADFRATSESVNGQAVSLGYDADGLLTQAGALALTRDAPTGFLAGTTLGLVTDTWDYSAFGEVASYQASANGSPVFAVTYQRDKLGRIVEKTETVEGVTTVTGYRYDAAGRLDQVTADGVVTAEYTYDANGNRLSATTPGGTDEGTYDAQDRLLSYGDATYTYTANGELRTKTDASGTTTYTYDLMGNLTRVDLPGGRVIEYLIDGQNRRIGKTVDGVLVQGWLYRDQLKPLAELDGNGQVVARFVYGGNPLVPDYMIKGGATYRILTDHLGSPRLVVDTSTGAVVQRRNYDAWGRVTLDTNPGFQPFGFAGGLDDPDTKLVRFGVRDYNPETGRWTAKDPIRFDSGTVNLFAYVGGDPVDRVDPTGLAELYYWEPIYPSVKGHLALRLDDGTYISSWPARTPSPFYSVPIRPPSYEADRRDEGREPIVVEISGLDEQKMRVWWEAQLSRNRYKVDSWNCTDVVFGALTVGGLPMENYYGLDRPDRGFDQLMRRLAERRERWLNNALR